MSTTAAMGGLKMSAVLLLSLPKETAASVLSHMSEDEIIRITSEIEAMPRVEGETIQMMEQEFFETWDSFSQSQQAGLNPVVNLVSQAVSDVSAKRIIEEVSRGSEPGPFSWLKPLGVEVIGRTLADELPEVSAIVLSFLGPELSAAVCGEFEEDYRHTVGALIATLSSPSTVMVGLIEDGLHESVGPDVFEERFEVGGVDGLVELLNYSDRATETKVLAIIAEQDEDLAAEVKRRLFLFEDMVELNDRAIQRVLADVNTEKLPMAMKGISPQLREKIIENVSERVAETLVDDIEILGAVPAADVFAAQSEVVAIINQLETDGEIVLNRGGGEMLT